MKDLFEYPELLPQNVNDIIERFAEEDDYSYESCDKLYDELYLVGYTFDYGLDAEPYNLRKLEDANEDVAHLAFALQNQN